MKRKTVVIFSVVILVFALLFTGCNLELKLPGEPEDVSQVGINNFVTRVQEVTDREGVVVGTESVTLSNQEIQEGKEFYSEVKEDAETGISVDRYEEAEKSDAQNEESIFESKNYYVVGRIVKDGKSSVYKLAQSDKKYAIMTVYNGAQLGVIIDNINLYLVQIEKKSYITIPKALLLDYDNAEVNSLLEDDLLDSDKKCIENGTTTLDGKEVSYNKFDDGSISYYKGNTILMSESSDGTVIYYDTVYSSAPSGFFAPPAGYTPKALTPDNIKEFSDLIGGTTVE